MIVLAGQSNVLNMAPALAWKNAPAVVAKGGSRIGEWLPGHPLFQAIAGMMPQTDMIFFWQGETEAMEGVAAAKRWGGQFTAFFAEIQKLKPFTPILVGQCPPVDCDVEALLEVRREQWQACEASGGLAELILAADLRMNPREKTHVHPEGLYQMAYRVSERMREIVVSRGWTKKYEEEDRAVA